MFKMITLLCSLPLLSGCTLFIFPPDPPLATPSPVVVDTVHLEEGLDLGLDRKVVGWTISKVVPHFLVEEHAEHLKHEMAEKGETPEKDRLVALVRRRMADNDLYIYNRQSKARILLDASRLNSGERAPTRKELYRSAKRAAGSLAAEDGVTELVYNVESAYLHGVDYAFRLTADYKLHNDPRRFTGLVAYTDPYWLYVYCTDLLVNSDDYRMMDDMLKALTVIRSPAPSR